MEQELVLEMPDSPASLSRRGSSLSPSMLMLPPRCSWVPRQKFACFLSHYKMEAASEARYLKDLLQRMLDAPVFLDSEDLVDLRDLFDGGVRSSDTLV
eukprot:1465915-Prymnesium_polylepis.1